MTYSPGNKITVISKDAEYDGIIMANPMEIRTVMEATTGADGAVTYVERQESFQPPINEREVLVYAPDTEENLRVNFSKVTVVKLPDDARLRVRRFEHQFEDDENGNPVSQGVVVILE